MSAILRVERLCKAFRGLQAMTEVLFEIAAGSITSIIGPNGAGKSTLFNLITGYLPPTAGEIAFNGRRITGMATNRIAELGIARAFQIARPFRDLTAAVWRRFPETPPYAGEHTEPTPHLTIGHDHPRPLLDRAAASVSKRLPVRAAVGAVRLVRGSDAAGSWHTVAEFPLGRGRPHSEL